MVMLLGPHKGTHHRRVVKMKLNQIQIVGNVGKTIEEKTFEDGNKVTNFTVAHTYKTETEWFYVNAYDELGDAVLKELNKGTRVRVIGTLKAQRFQKKDGSGQDFRLVIRLESFEVLPREGDASAPKKTKRIAA
jgi:single-strand DNA-binding protein